MGGDFAAGLRNTSYVLFSCTDAKIIYKDAQLFSVDYAKNTALKGKEKEWRICIFEKCWRPLSNG